MVTDIGDRQLGCPLLATIAELVWSVTILTQGALDCRTHPGGPSTAGLTQRALNCRTHPGGPSTAGLTQGGPPVKDSPRGPSTEGLTQGALTQGGPWLSGLNFFHAAHD